MKENSIEFRYEKILKEKKSIILSNEDRENFLYTLENPPKPSKRLIKALKIHSKLSRKK